MQGNYKNYTKRRKKEKQRREEKMYEIMKCEKASRDREKTRGNDYARYR